MLVPIFPFAEPTLTIIGLSTLLFPELSIDSINAPKRANLLLAGFVEADSTPII